MDNVENMMDMTKQPLPICRNCKHCKAAWMVVYPSLEFAKCNRPTSRKSDRLVTGSGGFFCSTEREGYDARDCGPSGQYFEPKPASWWVRLLRIVR
jgi:hypothetical protein